MDVKVWGLQVVQTLTRASQERERERERERENSVYYIRIDIIDTCIFLQSSLLIYMPVQPKQQHRLPQ